MAFLLPRRCVIAIFSFLPKKYHLHYILSIISFFPWVKYFHQYQCFVFYNKGIRSCQCQSTPACKLAKGFSPALYAKATSFFLYLIQKSLQKKSTGFIKLKHEPILKPTTCPFFINFISQPSFPPRYLFPVDKHRNKHQRNK